ncbi:MAG: UDP-N-acetylmuramate:L-alanyl-gamma-D-glutamyl-meso-diaminopimelate ligase [Anaerolineales bacterium]|nr:UDP-N-acetylmuramate:L-alanyl-gamma-D-glutamyl-meso-diaminopimelate ligase [Anaerolineales bacterium]
MHIHILGICGTFMAGIAAIAKAAGHRVTGSDRNVYPPMSTQLESLGIGIVQGYEAAQLEPRPDVVVVGNVMSRGVPVIEALLDSGIPYVSGPEWLSRTVLADRWVIAVAGTHGKTTTSCMLAWILEHAGLSPGFLIGGVPGNFDTSARLGAEPFFVIEADEYDYMFLGLHPALALVTNVEHDHPDMFPTAASFQAAFERFVERLQPDGELIACADDPGARALLEYAAAHGHKTSSYAHSHSGAEYQMQVLATQGAGYAFAVLHAGAELARVQLQVPGLHNALNALGALAVAHKLGLNVPEAALALGDFRGTSRRFETRGLAAGVRVIDDYAHHPREIAATLAAARGQFPGQRIVAVWQPHTYSRTHTLAADYASAFEDADQVFVLDVFAARERQPADFDLANLVTKIAHSAFTPTFAQAQQALLAALRPGDVLVVMSAGDAIQLSAALFAALQEKESHYA